MGSRRCKRSNVSSCVIDSSVNAYITTHCIRWLIKQSCSRLPSVLPMKHQVGKYWSHMTPQCRASKMVTWQIPTLRVVWQIPWIWPYFKVIPGQFGVMLGSAIPGQNQVVAGYPSHLYTLNNKSQTSVCWILLHTWASILTFVIHVVYCKLTEACMHSCKIEDMWKMPTDKTIPFGNKNISTMYLSLTQNKNCNKSDV